MSVSFAFVLLRPCVGVRARDFEGNLREGSLIASFSNWIARMQPKVSKPKAKSVHDLENDPFLW